ncbi:MAG: molybdopterin-dependent oxidoreductase, partial [Limnochordales bacterium]
MTQPRDRIPPGQTVTTGWPVLHEGPVPAFDPANWDLRVFGEVERPLVFTYEEFRQLPTRTVRCYIHSVTHWSNLDNGFEG